MSVDYSYEQIIEVEQFDFRNDFEKFFIPMPEDELGNDENDEDFENA